MARTSFCRRLLSTNLLHGSQKKRQTTFLAAMQSPETEENRVRSFDDLPGPSTVPILGGLIHHFPFGAFHGKTPPEIYKMCREKYGDIYKEQILHLSLVNVFDPDDFETVLRSDGKYPIRDAFMTLGHYNKHYNNDEQGVLTSQNERWHDLRSKFQRKMLRPKAAASYFKDHALIADELVEKIRLTIDSECIIDDLRSDLHKYATDCLAMMCFNKRFNLLLAQEENAEARKLFEAASVIMDTCHHEFRRLPLYKLFETSSFKKFVNAQNFIKEISLKYSKDALDALEQREKDGKSVDGEHGDLIPYLISKTSLTEEKVFTVISEMIFVGVDTTSHHLAYMMYLLGTHPEVQDTLYQEIKRTADRDSLCADAVSQMSYLKAVDKEVHRLYPVAAGTIRTLTQDIELKGYHLPKGTTVALHWICSSLDEKQFKNAKAFKPERWLRNHDERKDIHPYASIPFGVGPRSCIGRRFAEQETFLAVVKILQKYQVQYVGEDLELDYGVSVAPAKKMRLKFTPRN